MSPQHFRLKRPYSQVHACPQCLCTIIFDTLTRSKDFRCQRRQTAFPVWRSFRGVLCRVGSSRGTDSRGNGSRGNGCGSVCKGQGGVRSGRCSSVCKGHASCIVGRLADATTRQFCSKRFQPRIALAGPLAKCDWQFPSRTTAVLRNHVHLRSHLHESYRVACIKCTGPRQIAWRLSPQGLFKVIETQINFNWRLSPPLLWHYACMNACMHACMLAQSCKHHLRSHLRIAALADTWLRPPKLIRIAAIGTQVNLGANECHSISTEGGTDRQVVRVKKPGCYPRVLREQVGW